MIDAKDREALIAVCDGDEFDAARAFIFEFIERNKETVAVELGWRHAQKMAKRIRLPKYRLSLLSTFTLGPMASSLSLRFFIGGRDLAVQFIPYGQWQSALAEKGVIDEFAPDAVAVFFHAEDVLSTLSRKHLAGAADLVSETSVFLTGLDSAIRAFRHRGKVPLVVNTLAFMERGFERFFDWNMREGRQNALDLVNEKLAALCRSSTNTYVFDYAGLVADVGRSRWYDHRQDLNVRLPLTPLAQSSLAREFADFIFAMQRPRKKVLVVDLDNTIWGGVVGEDLPDGLAIGSTYPGNAFTEFQDLLLNLRSSGVLLAIASKNDEKDAKEVFDKRRADMVLKWEDFSAHQVHWGDKPLSLDAIAADLNLGIDSLVFADDSPVECDLMRSYRRDVSVIDLGADPAEFTRRVVKSGAFDAICLTAEDSKRAELYSTEVSRKSLAAEVHDKGEYLKQLQMKLSITAPSGGEIERVVQLINKTNQFNLTTQRYQASDVLEMIGSNKKLLLVSRLQDRFGSHGLIGAHILSFDDAQCMIDTFLMSCRVLGRKVEDAVLAQLEYEARDRAARTFIGIYRQTSKNTMVKDFYSDRGFVPVAGKPGHFERNLENVAPMAIPACIEVLGRAES